jgi:hypothetical protein
MKEENWVEGFEKENVELWSTYDGKLNRYPESEYELEPSKVIKFVKKIESAAHARGREETIKEIREKIEKVFKAAEKREDRVEVEDIIFILDTLTEKE